MSGLFRKETSAKKSILKEKRGTFFARQTGRRKDSPQEETKDRAESQAAPAGNPQRDQAEAAAEGSARSQEKDGYMIRCPKCGKMVNRDRVAKRKYICYECDGYFRVRTNNRIRMVADPHTFEP